MLSFFELGFSISLAKVCYAKVQLKEISLNEIINTQSKYLQWKLVIENNEQWNFRRQIQQQCPKFILLLMILIKTHLKISRLQLSSEFFTERLMLSILSKPTLCKKKKKLNISYLPQKFFTLFLPYCLYY